MLPQKVLEVVARVTEHREVIEKVLQMCEWAERILYKVQGPFRKLLG